jgi:hypothetical protein
MQALRISLRKLLTLLLLSAASLAAALRTLPPRPLPADAPAQQFSAGRLFETIQAITSTSPRLVGSPAFEAARAVVLAQMRLLANALFARLRPLDKLENIFYK